MMQRSKETVVAPSGPSTRMTFGDVNVPVPRTTSTLRCLASPSRPFVRRATTDSFHERRPSRSISGAAKVMPWPLASSLSAITRATWSSALDGMHPTFRQTPPRRS
jgi:hypothetical protein